MRYVFTCFIFFLFTFAPSAQTTTLLQSGPMVGYSEMQEVLLWVQTKKAAKVQIRYWVASKPADTLHTTAVITTAETAFTAHLLADRVEPGNRYDYLLLIDGKPVKLDYPTTFQTQTLWQWRTDPPAFKMAIGSCAYVNETQYDRPGKPYGADYQIFQSIHKMRPDAMLWLGDNTYLREVDWNTRTGILKRYTHSRSIPEMQALLASTHNYAIWDDHDFGPDNSDRSFAQKHHTLEAFKLFWANPSYGLDNSKGITSFFQFADVDFFLLDNRYNRAPDNRKTGDRTMLGKEQLEWLIDGLAASRAPFKMVAIGGQVLNTAAVHENYINYYPEEREYLLKRIEEEKIKGVVFLTGDRHHTEMDQYTNGAGNLVTDITISPLTAGHAFNVTEDNKYHVEGTLVLKRNFGVLEFSGPRTSRMLTVKIYDSNGAELWVQTIKPN
ncbi:MAG: alkaline phosphatase D family protein [Saprospiraceae bacterium]|nr:alkaline phosphatase D family protein [Saprospiraceae bacterium]MDZ4703786.1 alkaline phosphatase D family protein [Saprospiraceae bacterium]